MKNETEFVSGNTIAREIADLKPEDVTRIRMAADRSRAQMLCLWKLCPKSACRKAGACSADPNFCLGRFEVLLSENVRMAVEALLVAKLFGHSSYDEACAMAPPGSIEAYNLWLANLFSQETAPAPAGARD